MKISLVVSWKPSRSEAAIEMLQVEHLQLATVHPAFQWTWKIDLRHLGGKKGCLL